MESNQATPEGIAETVSMLAGIPSDEGRRLCGA